MARVRFYAEVNSLSKDGGDSKWVRVFPNVVGLTARKCQGPHGYFVRVSVKKDGSHLGVDIPLPVSRLKKTSGCFIQWRDKKKGGAWGVNFVAEKDADSFHHMCMAPVDGNVKRNSLTSSCSSVIMPLKIPEPPKNGFDIQQDLPSPIIVGQKVKLKAKLPFQHSLDDSDFGKKENKNLSDSGIGHDTEISSAMNYNKVSKVPNGESDSGSSTGYVADTSSYGYSHVVSYINSSQNIPLDMDPTEFAFLRGQSTTESQDENHNNQLLGADLNNSSKDGLSVSQNSLIVPSNYDDDGANEDVDGNLRPPSAIVQNRQIGTIRKAAWLVVKNMLIHSKKGKLELASNRRWKKYWVVLKGIELMFYHCDEKTVTSQDLDEPSYKLDVDQCLLQAVPEHAKLDNVFSLSSKYGNAYYFQATSQVEVENWIHCIHSASASAFARKRGVENVVEAVSSEIKRLEGKLTSDERMRKMAELQSKVVTDQRNKQAIFDQIHEWERSLENLSVESFRFRHYLAAVQGTPSPNPQSLLTCASKPTKQALAKLGVFSIASFHAYVCVREGSTAPPSKVEKPRSKRGVGIRSKLVQSLKIADNAMVAAIRTRHSPKILRRMSATYDDSDGDSASSSGKEKSLLDNLGNDFLKLQLPDQQSTIIPKAPGATIQDVVNVSCEKRNLDASDHFLLILSDKTGKVDYDIPNPSELLERQVYTTLKVCQKLTYDVELSHPADYDTGSFGLGLTQSGNGAFFVASVEEGSPARKSGIQEGDEVLTLNGQELQTVSVSIAYVREILNSADKVTLVLRSSRISDQKKTRQTTDSLISFLVCPPPPKSTLSLELTDDAIDSLIVPSPLEDENGSTCGTLSVKSGKTDKKGDDIDALLKRAEEVNVMFRQVIESGDEDQRPIIHMSSGVKLRKIIVELIDTEKTYVKDKREITERLKLGDLLLGVSRRGDHQNLRILLDRYLYPLRDEDFLSRDEADMLVGNVSEIYEFQTSFLESLEEAINTDAGFNKYSNAKDFGEVLYTIGEIFLGFVDKFKLYSTFCSCHSRAVKLLDAESNDLLQAFLEARNPSQQHSGTLESFLITPIQRILRYPLLMKSMFKLMDEDSSEYKCLMEALNSVEKVANYINEMQRISETYTPMFQELCENFEGIEPVDMAVDNLLHYGQVKWRNSGDDKFANGTIRKSPATPKAKRSDDNDLTVFVFKKAVILTAHEQKTRKKTTVGTSSSLKVKTSQEIRYQALIPIGSVLIRDYAWSDNDTNHYVWEIVDTGGENEPEPSKLETTYIFVNRTAEEKKVFVNAIKEATKINSLLTTNNHSPAALSQSGRTFSDSSSSLSSSILPSKPILLPSKPKRTMASLGIGRDKSDSDSSSVVSTVSKRSASPAARRRNAGFKKLQSVFQ